MSVLNDYLASQQKSDPGSHSLVATDANAALEECESDSANADESDNPDTLQPPE